MSFEQKYALAIKELEASSIRKSNYTPPLLQALYKLGVKTPPPHYNPFLKNLILTGSPFGFFWGLFMYLSTWRNSGLTATTMLIVACSCGLAFGLFMAAYYKISASRHKLTPWEKLETQN